MYQIKQQQQFFRKGFIYKPFTIKQVESQGVRPTMDEREQFL